MTSRVRTIAREDLRRLLRARTAQATFLLVAVTVGVFGWLNVSSGAASGATAVEAVADLPFHLEAYLFVLVVGLSFGAVVGEREGATLRLLLGLPGTRRDVFVGKLLSRVAAVGLALIVLLAVLAVSVVVVYGQLPVVPFVVVAAWVLLYGAAWTAFAVGVSAALASRFKVLAMLVASYLLVSPLAQFWYQVVEPTAALVVTGSFSREPFIPVVEETPEWALYVEALNPVVTFSRMGQWLVTIATGGQLAAPLGPVLASGLVVVLLGAVPAVVGARRFERADLSGDTGTTLRDALVRGVRSVERRLPGVPAVGAIFRRGTVGATTRLAAHLPGSPGTSWERPRLLLVARHEFRAVRRNPIRLVAVGLVAAVVTVTYWQVVGAPSRTVAENLRQLPFLLRRYGVVLAVAVGYGAVASDREADTLRLLLGLPATRRDVLGGTLLARVTTSVAVFVPLLSVLGGIVVVKPGLSAHHHGGGGYGPFPVGLFVLLAGLIVLYGTAWTALTVAASAALASRYRGLAAVFGAFLLFDVDMGLWTPVVEPVLALLFTGSPTAPPLDAAVNGTGPLWYVYIARLNPTIALASTADWLLSLVESGPPTTGVVPVLFSVVALVLFGAVAVAAGYRRFARADLG